MTPGQFVFDRQQLDGLGGELTAANNAVHDAVGSLLLRIVSQREEIIVAFIAKYGYQPDEVEQVMEITPSGWKWYVRKRE